jgi:hypothetical protein
MKFSCMHTRELAMTDTLTVLTSSKMGFGGPQIQQPQITLAVG